MNQQRLATGLDRGDLAAAQILVTMLQRRQAECDFFNDPVGQYPGDAIRRAAYLRPFRHRFQLPSGAGRNGRRLP
jgi:hypothetical protein